MSETLRVSAAGRVNIIGEHIDYCGGKVLPAALSLKNTVCVRPNGTDKVNLSWTTLPDKVTLDINDLNAARESKYAKYQAGSLLMWARDGHKIVGCDMKMDCTVPFGSGLSSSAAIEVSTIAAMAAVTGENADPVRIAQCAQRAEIEFAGVNCGIMDQYASACGRRDHVLLLDCKTLDCKYVPFTLGDYALVIIDCKKPHNLVESKYNERRAQTEAALEILKSKAEIDCLCDLTPDEFERYSAALPELLRNRARHVVYESARVSDAVAALEAGDIPRLGELLILSHKSMRDLYEVTGREPDALALSAWECDCCVGSRMTGGGFGGCTVSLVHKEGVTEFERYVCKRYKERTGYDAACYRATVEDGIIIGIGDNGWATTPRRK